MLSPFPGDVRAAMRKLREPIADCANLRALAGEIHDLFASKTLLGSADQRNRNLQSLRASAQAAWLIGSIFISLNSIIAAADGVWKELSRARITGSFLECCVYTEELRSSTEIGNLDLQQF